MAAYLTVTSRLPSFLRSIAFGSFVAFGLSQSMPAQTTFYADLAPFQSGLGDNADFTWATSFYTYWTTDQNGNGGVAAWDNSAVPKNNAVLGNGLQTGTYTAYLGDNISVGSVSIVNGAWRISLTLGPSSYILTLDSSTDSSLAASVIGSGSLVKSGSSLLTLTSVNNFSGGTTISGGTLAFANTNTNVGPVVVNSGGTLQYGDSAALPASTSLSLAGGTLKLAAAYSPTFTTGLNLLASSTINFGSGLGASAITFGDSSGATGWAVSTTLTITNYNSASDTLRFGTSASGLTSAQVAAINFDGLGAQIDSNGFVTPVPEPTTYATILGAAALVFVTYRRRHSRSVTA